MAKTPDESLCLIYLPVNTQLTLNGDFSGRSIRAYDLSSRRTAWLTPTFQEGVTTLPMHPFEEDVLLILR